MSTTRRKPIAWELAEQEAVVHYLRRVLGLTVYATLTGVRLPIGAAVKAKRQGMLAGAPDLHVVERPPLYPDKHAVIEMKRVDGGRLSDEQRAVRSRMEACGWIVVVGNGYEDAVTALATIGWSR